MSRGECDSFPMCALLPARVTMCHCAAARNRSRACFFSNTVALLYFVVLPPLATIGPHRSTPLFGWSQTALMTRDWHKTFLHSTACSSSAQYQPPKQANPWDGQGRSCRRKASQCNSLAGGEAVVHAKPPGRDT